MKKILVFLLIVGSNCFGQANENESNFKVEDNKVIWQKVYDISVSPSQYLSFIRLKNCLESIDTVQNTIIGKLKRFKPDTYGVSRMALPIYITSNTVYADVKIEVKENKYRVTLSNIKVLEGVNAANPNSGYASDFEIYYFKMFDKSIPKPSFTKVDAPLFTKNFDSFFEYKKTTTDF